MQFELKRCTATFGVYNPREEKNKGPAADIPFSVTIGAEILGMLCPAIIDETFVDDKDDGEVLIDQLFNAEGYIKRPALNPLHINRKPEGVTVTIFDRDSRDPLVLQGCRLKGLTATLQTPHQIQLQGKIQYQQYNDRELVRINSLMNKQCDVTMLAEQSDLFDNHGLDPAGGQQPDQGAKDDVDGEQLNHEAAPVSKPAGKATKSTKKKPAKKAAKKVPTKKTSKKTAKKAVAKG